MLFLINLKTATALGLDVPTQLQHCRSFAAQALRLVAPTMVAGQKYNPRSPYDLLRRVAVLDQSLAAPDLQEEPGYVRSCPYRQTRILTPIWESSDASGTLAGFGLN